MTLTHKLLAFLLICALPSVASVLTFDITSGGVQLANNSAIPQAYGGRITAVSMTNGGYTFLYGSTGGFTPNVVVSYGPAAETSGGCTFTATCIYLWDTAFGSLTNVIAQAAREQTDPNDAGKVLVTLTADPGYYVTLSSFALAGWNVTDRIVRSLSVLDGSNNVLYSASSLTAPGSGSLVLGTTQFGGMLSASVLKILIDAGGLGDSNGQNVGLDNVVFGQTEVPEPSTCALLAGALCLGALRLRRR